MKQATAPPSFQLVGASECKNDSDSEGEDSNVYSRVCEICQASGIHGTSAAAGASSSCSPCCPHRYQQEQEHSSGDPLRKVSVNASDFVSACQEDSPRLPTGERCTIKSYTFERLPKGQWEVIVIFKVNRLDFGCDMSVWTGDENMLKEDDDNIETQQVQQQQYSRLEFHKDYDAVETFGEHAFRENFVIGDELAGRHASHMSSASKLLSRHTHQWVLLSLGTLTLPTAQNIHFEWTKWPASSPGGGTSLGTVNLVAPINRNFIDISAIIRLRLCTFELPIE
jgi:hypothetical protein